VVLGDQLASLVFVVGCTLVVERAVKEVVDIAVTVVVVAEIVVVAVAVVVVEVSIVFVWTETGVAKTRVVISVDCL